MVNLSLYLHGTDFKFEIKFEIKLERYFMITSPGIQVTDNVERSMYR